MIKNMVTVPYRNFDFYRKALHMIGNIYIYLLKKNSKNVTYQECRISQIPLKIGMTGCT